MTKIKAQAGKSATYAASGVDIEAGNLLVQNIKPLAASTQRLGGRPDLGGFGGLFDLKALGYKDPLLVACNDGVGTKIKIAIEAQQHDTIGIDLVAMCVNDLIVQGAEPIFFLDYLAVGKLNPEEATQIIAGIAEGCRQAGCALIGGETAEMPGLYQGKDYDLAGFSVGVVERDRLLPYSSLKEGDCLLALASDGLHSNGFSLVRQLVAEAGLRYHDKAPFAEATLANALLTPTRLYVRPLLAALQHFPIKALAHITGGGIVENLPRILPKHLSASIELEKILVPPVFSWLAATGDISQTEMLRTFNCGVGMIIIVDAEDAEKITAFLTAQGERVTPLGQLTQRGDEKLQLKGKLSL